MRLRRRRAASGSGYTPSASVVADYGSYALSGQAAGLLRAVPLVAAQGSFTLSGQAATLTYVPSTLDGSESDGTNLLTGGYANTDLSGGGWAAQVSSFTTGQTSPNGGSNAVLLTETATTNIHRTYANTSVSTIGAGSAATMSFYAKMNGRRYLSLTLRDSGDTNGFSCCFDLQAGTAGATANSGNGSYTSSSVQNGANSYFKLTVTGVISTSAVSNIWFYASMSSTNTAGSAPSYAGDGSSGIYLWRPKVTSP